jgi:hypothetical protein
MFGQSTVQRRGPFNAGLVIGVIVLLVALVPTAMVVPGFGELGHPATLLCLLLMAVWVATRLHHSWIAVGAQPMRWLVWLCLAAAFGSYAAGLWRGMTPGQEETAILALAGGLGFAGVVLATSEGIRGKERLNGLLCVMLVGAAIIAVIGLLWEIAAVDVMAYLEIPGLVRRGEGGAARITPEIGVVMALMLPFAIHMGRFAASRALRQWMALTGMVMAVALVTAASGAGLLALGVMLVVMIPAWNWRTRFNLLGPSLLAIVGAVYLFPELPQSVAALFSAPGNDVVAMARGTWLPIQESAWPAGYWVVGMAAVALLHFGAFVMAAIAFGRCVMLADRHLCACLMATQVIALALGFTVAPLGLETYAIFIAIATGACAAMWRITTPRIRRVVRAI